VTRKVLRGRNALDALLRGIVGVMRGTSRVRRDSMGIQVAPLQVDATPDVLAPHELATAAENLGTHLLEVSRELWGGDPAGTSDATWDGLDAAAVHLENERLRGALEYLQHHNGNPTRQFVAKILEGSTVEEARPRSRARLTFTDQNGVVTHTMGEVDGPFLELEASPDLAGIARRTYFEPDGTQREETDDDLRDRLRAAEADRLYVHTGAIAPDELRSRLAALEDARSVSRALILDSDGEGSIR
jgi:hypothetical protein